MIYHTIVRDSISIRLILLPRVGDCTDERGGGVSREIPKTKTKRKIHLFREPRSRDGMST